MERNSSSFSFDSGGARHVLVRRGDEEIAEITRHTSIRLAEVDIRCQGDEGERDYKCISGGIYLNEDLVGRVYEVRGFHYIDIEKKHLCEGILAFFITIG